MFKLKFPFILILVFILSGCWANRVLQNDLTTKIVYYENTRQKRLEYTVNGDGQFDGLYNEFYMSGSLKYQCVFETGVKVDYEMGWYESGTLSFLSTVIEQKLKTVKIDEGHYADKRVLTKLYEEFHENEFRKLMGFYIEDVRVGSWYFWSEKGRLDSSIFYLEDGTIGSVSRR